MNKHTILYLLFGLLIFTGCSDNGTGTGPGQAQKWTTYTINAGNFSDANGSITAYNYRSDVVSDTAYQYVNSGDFVGLIQTSTIIDGRLYVIGNVPDKIEVLQSKTLKKIGTIRLSRDPVAIAPADNGRAYVTNLNGRSVSILNLKSMQATGDSIVVGANPYFAFNKNGNVYVSNNGFGASKTISVIDTKSDKVTNTLKVGHGPKQIVEGPAGRLWVVCQGYSPYQHPEKAVTGGIYIVDPKQPAVVDSIKNGQNPKQMTIDDNDNRAYVAYSSGKVAAINTNTLSISDADFIDRNFNAIGYSPDEHLLYLGQTKGFKQDGQAIRYNLQGTAVDSFDVGISPIGFKFVTN